MYISIAVRRKEMKNYDTKSFELEVDVKSAVPIYAQIKNAVKMAVFSGKLADGDKLVSIRDLASRFGINPITIMKAYGQLEQEGFLHSKRGAGYFIQVEKEIFQKQRKEHFHKEIAAFLNRIAQLGYTLEDFMEALKEFMNTQEEEQGDDNN